MVEPAHHYLSISARCRLLSISRSSYYYAPVPETDETLALMAMIGGARGEGSDHCGELFGAGDSLLGSAAAWAQPFAAVTWRRQARHEFEAKGIEPVSRPDAAPSRRARRLSRSNPARLMEASRWHKPHHLLARQPVQVARLQSPRGA